MLDKTDLIEAIGHYEDHIKDIKDCEALASLYTIYDHKYKTKDSEPICELIIQVDNTSRFLSAINGKRSCDVWRVIDDLMSDLAEKEPVLYEQTMNRILH